MNGSVAQIQKGLGPVARAIVGGNVSAVTPPAGARARAGQKSRYWTVALEAPGGILAVLVPDDHKIYARVASRARRGDFSVIEAGLALARGRIEIRARHVLSSRDTYLPRAASAACYRAATNSWRSCGYPPQRPSTDGEKAVQV